MTEHEAAFMQQALTLAERGWGRVSPNPMVGTVVTRDGEIVGEGWHEGPGTRHAEVMALETAGPLARGATLIVTLEPCDHTGRTGPCTKAVIDAGIRRVVAGSVDPNPVVRGRGFQRLRDAGVDVVSGVQADAEARLNHAFAHHVTTGLPSVTLKMASSLDGKAAAADGSSQWITGEEARADVQRLRAWADAVVVGAGTALADDPALTVRDDRWTDARPPVRVLVDAAGRVPATGRLFDRSAPTLVATTGLAPEARQDEWARAGADVLVLEPSAGDTIAPTELLQALGKRDVQGVLVEGGPTLAWSFVEAGLVDRLVLYVAPLLVGGERGWLHGAGFAPIAEALRVTQTSIERMGDDLRIEADVHRDH